MKAIKRILGVATLTAVMAIGAMQAFTATEASAGAQHICTHSPSNICGTSVGNECCSNPSYGYCYNTNGTLGRCTLRTE